MPPKKTNVRTKALESDVARIVADDPKSGRRGARGPQFAYEEAANEAARLTATTQRAEATPDDHRRAARANRAAAEKARAIRGHEAATGHERLALAHDQTAGRKEAEAPLSDPEIARAVLDAIRQIGPSGRFGPDKVFISEIWTVASRDPRIQKLTMPEFKRALVRINRTRIINLARADLVGAMDPRLVRASEINDRGADFHFVLDPDQASPY